MHPAASDAGPSASSGRGGAPGTTETASTSGREAGMDDPPLVMLIIGRAGLCRLSCLLAQAEAWLDTGMAGSGKTTLLQRINTYLHEKGRPGYLLNLDPAVTDTPYEPNIDIRDTVC